MRWPLLIFFWSGGSSSHPVRSFTNQRPLEALGAGIGHGKRGGRSGRPGGIAPALVNSVSLRVAKHVYRYYRTERKCYLMCGCYKTEAEFSGLHARHPYYPHTSGISVMTILIPPSRGRRRTPVGGVRGDKYPGINRCTNLDPCPCPHIIPDSSRPGRVEGLVRARASCTARVAGC